MDPMIPVLAQLQRPDYFVLVGYFVLMLGIGVYFFGQRQGMKDYFTGGNRIPWWLSGVSFYMSSFSGFTFLAYSALAYQYGWVAVTLFWVTVPASLVSAVFFSARWRRARPVSPVEYLETRFSPTARQLFAWEGIPVKLIDDVLKLIAIGTFISVVLELGSSTASILCSGLIILLYTFMGGLWAVTVTDFVQFVVMVAAAIILIPLSLAAAGGLTAFVANAPEGFFRLTHREFGWGYVLCNVLLFTLAYSSVQWPLIQRYYCVPGEQDARKVGYLVAFLNLVGPPLLFLPAMAARHFLPAMDDTKTVYPALCVYLLPPGMLGLVIASMFSATMSMLSSDYNVCASVLTNDVYRRLVRPNASDRELVGVGRVMTLVMGGLALAGGIALTGTKGDAFFRTMIKLFSVATAPVGIPMLLGLLWRRMTNLGALAGFVVGLGLGLWVMLFGPSEATILGMRLRSENLVLLTTLSSTLVAMIGVSLLFRPDAAAVERIARFHRRLDTPIGEMSQDRGRGERTPEDAGVVSPFRVVGVSVALVGVMLLAVSPFLEQRVAFLTNSAIGLFLLAVGVLAVRRSNRKEVTEVES